MADKKNIYSSKKHIVFIVLLSLLLAFGLWRKYNTPQVSVPRKSPTNTFRPSSIAVKKSESPEKDKTESSYMNKAVDTNEDKYIPPKKSDLLTENSSQAIVNKNNRTSSTENSDDTDAVQDEIPLPDKLLRPLNEVRLSKRKPYTLCKDDLDTLDYINRKREAAGLKKLPILPTGLDDQECLQLLNGQLVEKGISPLPAMPTGAILKKENNK